MEGCLPSPSADSSPQPSGFLQRPTVCAHGSEVRRMCNCQLRTRALARAGRSHGAEAKLQGQKKDDSVQAIRCQGFPGRAAFASWMQRGCSSARRRPNVADPGRQRFGQEAHEVLADRKRLGEPSRRLVGAVDNHARVVQALEDTKETEHPLHVGTAVQSLLGITQKPC